MLSKSRRHYVKWYVNPDVVHEDMRRWGPFWTRAEAEQFRRELERAEPGWWSHLLDRLFCPPARPRVRWSVAVELESVPRWD